MNTKNNELEMNPKNILYKIEEIDKMIDSMFLILKLKNRKLNVIKEKSYKKLDKTKSQNL